MLPRENYSTVNSCSFQLVNCTPIENFLLYGFPNDSPNPVLAVFGEHVRKGFSLHNVFHSSRIRNISQKHLFSNAARVERVVGLFIPSVPSGCEGCVSAWTS